MTASGRPAVTQTRLPKANATPLIPAGEIRERTVLRRIAVCGWSGCEFDKREKPTLHQTAAGAEVESVRHLRKVHSSALTREVSAKRTARVLRTIEREEIIG